MKATVLKVAINLTNEGLLRARDARAVNDMIKRQNPALVAAFKVKRLDKRCDGEASLALGRWLFFSCGGCVCDLSWAC